MPKNSRVRPSDIRGYSRLTVDAIIGLTDLVETMHHNMEPTDDSHAALLRWAVA